MEDRLPKRLAAIAAGIRLARHPRPLRLDALGRNDKVWMVFVGNGRYGKSLGDVTTRWGDPSLASLQADLLSDMWDHLPTAHEPRLPLDAPV